MLRALGLTGSEIRTLPAQFALGVVAPQVLFYFGLRWGTLTTALVAAGAWTLGLQAYELMRRGALNPFLLYGLVFTVIQSAVALYARSAVVFAGGGIAENLLGGLVFLGSLAVCRPALVEVVGSIIREQAQAVLTLPMRAILGRLTLAWALLFIGRALGLYAGLMHLEIGRFLFVNTLAGWPLNAAGVLLSAAYVRAQVRRAGPSVPGSSCPRYWERPLAASGASLSAARGDGHA